MGYTIWMGQTDPSKATVASEHLKLLFRNEKGIDVPTVVLCGPSDISQGPLEGSVTTLKKKCQDKGVVFEFPLVTEGDGEGARVLGTGAEAAKSVCEHLGVEYKGEYAVGTTKPAISPVVILGGVAVLAAVTVGLVVLSRRKSSS
uniref:Uncharacterized protein n=1 Tax=Chromera velia CCMP2878 TaxID=1169474 RepID=A0A0G4HYM3_9ALVE|mmetsp:Transcript_36030/g.70893  ORF Transcript_36030/g.70893 Transcript_36030/m.70893 type:complete len:145 (+) Transcript_36030:92-526(+)|eukprot:Cvel_33643.t1-p1 / transcript=Cvel_33643.t1 / gene=Cvel_33643 / organism=Chromera_velia_CCMP2878 / gene_product=hypothetical protein / transcript_product=hypothetical protein / location=Cvel_scaffold5517:1329-1760(+) / protein_length=144 / sequence_SO=supercontig / SO=protein_coding / is_pseudo=false